MKSTTEISLAEIEKLAALARIALTDEEKKSLQQDMGSILTYVDQIKNAAGTTDVEIVGNLNVFRDDSNPHPTGMFTEDLLVAAPQREDNYFKVKKIL